MATGNTSARKFYERRGWIGEGPFVHDAPVPGGVVGVDCHRFISPPEGGRGGATPIDLARTKGQQ